MVDLDHRIRVEHDLAGGNAGVFSIGRRLQLDLCIIFKKTFDQRDFVVIGDDDEFEHIDHRPGLMFQLFFQLVEIGFCHSCEFTVAKFLEKPVHFTPVAFCGPSFAGMKNGWSKLPDLSLAFVFFGRCAVFEEFSHQLGADTAGRKAFYFHGSCDHAAFETDEISRVKVPGRFCRIAIELDLSAFAGFGGQASRLEQANTPEPFVDPSVFHRVLNSAVTNIQIGRMRFTLVKFSRNKLKKRMFR